MSPEHFKPLDPRAELLFLKRALEFLDKGFYIGGFEGLVKELFGEVCSFLTCFSIPRADKPDKPRLIINGGTKQE